MTDLPAVAESAAETPADTSAGPRRTALWEVHRDLGAKTADFGGWDMPVEYSGGGVLAEHEAVRTAVGLFDVSHLGKLRVTGPGAAAFLDSCLTNAFARIEPGRAQYTLCCTPEGGVVDDLIAYLYGPDDVLLVPNAANCADVAARLTAQAPAGVRIDDLHEDLAVLAVQGPRSAEVMSALGLPHEMRYMAFATTSWCGADIVVCRTGYTGEPGYELLVPIGAAEKAWALLLDAVRAAGGRPGGLGARDTLRTEMGYPLHGHELSTSISPVQARVGWAVGWSKPEFWGREALLAEREAGPSRLLVGLRATGRGVPRAGLDVLDGAGHIVGVTTSGTFSPTLRTGIALALIDTRDAVGNSLSNTTPGAALDIDVRGRRLPVEVVRPPFVDARPDA